MRIRHNKEVLNHGSRIVKEQLESICDRILDCDIEKDIKSSKGFRKLHGKGIDVESIKGTLFNGWNTESILRMNSILLNDKDNHFILQWSFPQSYYSLYMILISFFKINNEEYIVSHKGVRDVFYKYISHNRYPSSVSVYCKGTLKNKTFENLDFLEFKVEELLKTTRDIDLKSKKDFEVNNKTSKFHKRKRLNESDWEEIDKNLTPTTLLDYLYRKRIKSNYKDIETYTMLNEYSTKSQQYLESIVFHFNLINEIFICKIVGKNKFIKLYDEFIGGNSNHDFLKERKRIILDFFS